MRGWCAQRKPLVFAKDFWAKARQFWKTAGRNLPVLWVLKGEIEKAGALGASA
jgi:hypothetical protein